MRKLLSGIVAMSLVFSLILPTTQLNAAAAISVYVDGSKLAMDQPPVQSSGRVLLPMRAIFESLGARVYYNSRTRTVTGSKDGTTVVLKLGSKSATIDNMNVSLDVPANTLRGRTMVPVRFVSEALGALVSWNERGKTVTITTPDRPSTPDRPDNSDNVSGVSNVYAKVIGQQGDGSDLNVSFSKAPYEYNVDHYRIMVVKSSSSSSFNLSKARSVSSNNYTTAYPQGDDPSVRLDSRARDVDGDYIRNNQTYNVYVVTVGKRSSQMALSYPSSQISLSDNGVSAASNVQVRDVADYGDGRDMNVSFTRPQNDNNISNYRIMVVKTRDANRFDTSTANGVSSQNYSTVSKSSGTTLTSTLSSTARDTSGDYIRNGVPYTVFVLSVSNTNSYSNKLSSGSASMTLGQSVGLPVITKVSDVGNYGDGRDLQISFNQASDESKVSYYRIFAVRYQDANSFDLTEANKASYGRYHDVSKTGYSITTTLPSSMRDVHGSSIRNGETYRLFVMAVSNSGGSYNNALSTASDTITLSNNNIVSGVTNVTASDVSDYNDGRDLRVSFNRASDESDISQYRIMVVKASNANRFDLSAANNVSSYNYTAVSKTGGNISLALNSNARDVDGSSIRNGVSYQVFVLSVGRGSYNNALSSSSGTITLSNNSTVQAATNVSASDVNDYNDGRDLRVTFTRAADEANINHYRVMVVKADKAGWFSVSDANNVSSWNSTVVNRTGGNLGQTLASDARDVDGDRIRNGISYRVFVLSVSTGNQSSNALSYQSPAITLGGTTAVDVAGNVAANVTGSHGSGRDIEVSFTAPSNESNVAEYRIMAVRSDQAYAFNLSNANNVSASNYTRVSKQGAYVRQQLTDSTRDIYGDVIRKGVPYRYFILTVADGRTGTGNALSSSSGDVTLAADQSVPVASNVFASREGNNDFKVYFNKPSNDSSITYYAVMAVPVGDAGNFTLTEANRVNSDAYKLVSVSGDSTVWFSTSDRDAFGNLIRSDVAYKVFVMSVADGRNATVNGLSASSNEIITGDGY
ncbi:copper amine oxidase N-terminal domain-containing protein [Paenibacillus sp. MER TA 81-3]|uniref:copper amine oxidase N-terminal domain-containing protein n=1 Tax=Paenibacillus sp. MER TA 81-3 TaxID=2939573 RepID=UPI00203FFA3C|nr:copper amine oxidase N-terminal domain-containing protein [Paenibacillus sp. MER TA 81-3]MCM3339317.1 copper amine oxidase N-terminal domain-containing protein [Paenibacillus sp. MER TA 81-3]